MNTLTSPQDIPASGMNLSDAMVMLFKHKWKILLCSLAGFAAAGAVIFSHKPTYQSQAKVLVRYVVDTSAVDSLDGKATSAMNDSVISTEVEILTSWDLAVQVADKITPERLLPKAVGKATKYDAAKSISAGLQVIANHGSKVIWVSYKDASPEIATEVLAELITRYLEMHLEVHRSSGAFAYLSQQSDQMRSRLSEIDEDLKKRKGNALIGSLADASTALISRMAKEQGELAMAEAEHAEQRARLLDMQKAPTGATESTNESAGSPPNNDEVQSYRMLFARLDELRKAQLDLAAKYTPENRLVQLNRGEIMEVMKQCREMEKHFPALAAAAPTAGSATSQGARPDFLTERGRLAGIEAKIATLKAQIEETQKAFDKFSEGAPEIAKLERRKQVEEENAKYFAASLEKARIDETLNPSKMPNINVVQKPTPGQRTVADELRKLVMQLAGGGVALGLGLVALLELVFDRTIKRPLEVETRFRIPMLLSIPRANGKDARGMLTKRGNSAGGSEAQAPETLEIAPWEPSHFMRPYTEALRDRLVLEFELKKMYHKPKLVAVTGCEGGEGVSTVAAGLAVALSDTGDGKVLLVDMNAGQAQAHPFFEGRPTCSLSEVLQPGGVVSSAADNLYLAVPPASAGSSQIVPKRFYDLLPHLKATDFDYVIFDMPPLAQNSVSLAMSGFMDKVVVIVEAERTNRDFLKRSYDELCAARADVCAVVNKTRSHAPKWLAA